MQAAADGMQPTRFDREYKKCKNLLPKGCTAPWRFIPLLAFDQLLLFAVLLGVRRLLAQFSLREPPAQSWVLSVGFSIRTSSIHASHQCRQTCCSPGRTSE
jgi:hypothetical protein